jgi:hypothetical protein
MRDGRQAVLLLHCEHAPIPAQKQPNNKKGSKMMFASFLIYKSSLQEQPGTIIMNYCESW